MPRRQVSPRGCFRGLGVCMVDCHSRALCVGESVTALTGFCDENWGGRFVAHGKLWACFAEGKPMLSADVESHPNVAKSATLG
jgi:hypothetical protein